MAIFSITYNEGGNPIDYKSVEVYYSYSNKLKSFNTGDFVKDWYNAIKYYIKNLNEEHFICSSTIDHFFMDGADYDSAFLHIENDLPILKYIDKNDKEWYNSQVVEGIELFVKAGTRPTWEELKDYCE